MGKTGWVVLVLSLGLTMSACAPKKKDEDSLKPKVSPQSKIGVDAAGRCTFGFLDAFNGIRQEARMLAIMEGLKVPKEQLDIQKQVLGRVCFRLFKANAETHCLARIDYLEDEQVIHAASVKPVCDSLLAPTKQMDPAPSEKI